MLPLHYERSRLNRRFIDTEEPSIWPQREHRRIEMLIIKHQGCQQDTLAEWLRRRPAKPVGSARVGSNPTGVVFSCFSS